MKKLISALFLSLIITLAVAAGGVMHPVAECTGNYAWQVLDEVNRYRADYGLSPLVMSDELCDAADVRAQELITEFSHTRPDGNSCFSVIRGKYRHVAENIAAGHESAAETVEQWMNSPCILYAHTCPAGAGTSGWRGGEDCARTVICK